MKLFADQRDVFQLFVYHGGRWFDLPSFLIFPWNGSGKEGLTGVSESDAENMAAKFAKQVAVEMRATVGYIRADKQTGPFRPNVPTVWFRPDGSDGSKYGGANIPRGFTRKP